MEIIKLKSPKNYKDAGLQVINYAQSKNIQKDSFQEFLDNVLPSYLQKVYSYAVKDPLNNGYLGDIELTYKDIYYDYSECYDINYCRKFNKTRYLIVKATAVLNFLNASQVEFPVTITKLPIVENNGSLMVNGSYKIVISHLETNNCLHFDSYNNNSLEMKFKSILENRSPRINLTLNSVPSKDKPLIVFRINGLSINGNMGEYLSSLGYPVIELQDITGKILYSYIQSTNVTKTKVDKVNLSYTDISFAERIHINKKLSYESRIVGKYLQESILNYSKGDKITNDMAKDFQVMCKRVYISDEINSSGYYVYSNRFDYINNILKYHNIDLILDDNFIAHIPTVESIIDKFLLDKNQIKRSILENKHNIQKFTLTKEDVVSLINLFGHFISGKVPVENKFSLENKIIASVSEVYTQGLMKLMNYSVGSNEGINQLILGTANQILKDNKYNPLEAVNDVNIIISKLNQPKNITYYNDIIFKELNSYTQVDQFDNTSPFAEANNSRKVTFVEIEGRGGVKDKDASLEARMIHPSFVGRIDLNETSESASVGLVRYLTLTSIVNSERKILAPFFRVENGEVDITQVHYLPYEEEKLYNICFDTAVADSDMSYIKLYDKEGNLIHQEDYKEYLDKSTINFLSNNLKIKYKAHKVETFSARKNSISKQYVNVNGNDIKKREEVDYIIPTSEHLMSPVSSSNVFTNYNDNARILYSCNQTRQGISLIKPDNSLVISKATARFTNSTGVEKSPVNGYVEFVSNKEIRIRDIKTGELVLINLLSDVSTREHTLLTSIPNVTVGDFVMEGQIITDTNSIRDGQVVNGVNLRVGIMPFKGYNFEDGILISDKIIREGLLTSIHYNTEEIKVDLTERETNGRNKIPLKKYVRVNLEETQTEIDGIPVEPISSNYFANLKMYLNKDGTPKKGKKKPGDLLYCYYELKNKDGNYTYNLIRETYKEYIPIYVTGVEQFEEDGILYVNIHHIHEEIIEIGDKLNGRHGNKGVISKVIREMDMPYLEDGTRLDILLNPLGIPSRMNIGQIYELCFGEILNNTGYQIKLDNGINLDKNKILDLVSIYDGSDKQTVYDGVTGLPCQCKVAVGVSTIIKSKHQVLHKIHSRETGAYTEYRSPTKGRSSGGGQSVGYMEFHSLAELNCPNVLSEIINLKSDKTKGRKDFSDYMACIVEDLGDRELAKSRAKGDISKSEPYIDNNRPFISKMLDANLIASLGYPKTIDEFGNMLNTFMDKSNNIVQPRTLDVVDNNSEDIENSRKEVLDALSNLGLIFDDEVNSSESSNTIELSIFTDNEEKDEILVEIDDIDDNNEEEDIEELIEEGEE